MAKFLDSSGLQYFWNKIKSAMSGKQDTITDLSEIRSGAHAGSTALQNYTETDPVFTASAAHDIASSDISNWNSKEPAITAGTTTQYLRGDKTWQTLDKSVVGLGNVQNASINRSTNVNAADTGYTTLMARGEKLLDATTFDGVTNWGNQLVNGAIAWKYE